ncbi:hypothetical protein AJ80_08782 [Polytolypa hystricis UAMH7299]|uniref:Homeobox domain-containing protein n=1 Tax=Polytolypa hystricis (strain UAMH7299) TaxID=1447883 RepID=A0A2B7WU39_POLH7|nr:hypothetical protein AJ80_08782 [Polytolypa hystricis UAMH7299]
MSDSEHAAAADGPQQQPAPASDDKSTSTYAFLVHSQKTLTQNLPPKIDNKLLARQKRRRTSPEDYAILEAEYQQNPKPDKATRASIVSRVSLGEKEVQIWFQNRRQNDRRRSKPLEPHEYLPSKAVTSEPIDDDKDADEKTREYENESSQIYSNSSQEDPDQIIDSSQLSSSFRSNVDSEKADVVTSFCSSQTTDASPQQPETDNVVADNREREQEIQASSTKPVVQSDTMKRKRSISDLLGPAQTQTDRRSMWAGNNPAMPPPLRISLSFDGEAVVRREGEKTPSPPRPRDMRISMSADGEALIKSAHEASPSKKPTSLLQARRPPFGGLRRSSSAIVLGSSVRTVGQVEAKTFGRSRDARTWELHCDTDARSALSLSSAKLRRYSVTSPLALFTTRDGSKAQRKSEPEKRKVLSTRTNLPNVLNTVVQPTGKRQKLSRAVSSLARLESDRNILANKASSNISKKAEKTAGHGSKRAFDIYHSGDSDKENWVPGTRVSNVRRRGTQQQQRDRRSLLQKPTAAGRGMNSSRARQQSKANKENYAVASDDDDDDEHDDAEDEEIARFMAGAGGSTQEDDLDCVQGLLSLSQGAWR